MRTDLILDRNERKIIAYSEQDCDPILDWNAMLRSQSQKSDWGRHIATIPNVVLLKWFNEANDPTLRMYSKEWNEYVHKKLKDPEYAYLRVDK
jgi:hypothetical protein